MITCPACGHEVPDGSTSCPHCGAQLPLSHRSEERRVVTTLICDLVGFTALSERNDPEDVNALLRRYYEVARRVVHSYGGTVEKFIGDAVVAVFGVPTLHEDDPERGVRAALRLVDEIDAMAGIGGRPVEVRVGVNTGEALVALGVDPASGEGFLTGDAVNVAARLQAAAPPMAVAVGQATHAATERIFKFEACHPVTVKGKGAPVEAWIATASLARTGSELRSFTTTFVGREAELTELRTLLEQAIGSRSPRLGLIVGEPGIGKSRLLSEFARHLDELPELVSWRQGRCLPYGAGITFWALGEIVKACAGVLDSDGVARTEARLETVLPEGEEGDLMRARLRPLLGLEAEEAPREENFAVWRAFLEGLAASRPTVVVVEDLHWADAGMLAFMDELAGSAAQVPLLVLATARPEVLELTGEGAGFVAGAERIALGPLSGDETAQLVLARLGAKSLPVGLQATLLERSGGNPLFAEELVRLLEDGDLLVSRGGQTMLKEGAELPTPESIGALIAARLDLLAPERKALLADAAVVGRTFWAGAVAAVGGLESAAVFEGLHELVAKELVRPARGSAIEGETEFLFVHALVCDVAYSQLTRADRATKHAALARWLEERTGGRTEDLAEILAYHYGTALEMAGAAGLFDLEDELSEPTERYLAMAGGRAAPLDATAAAAHFARAQQVADEAARPKRRWLLSRRTRRTLRRRAPLLVAAAAIIVVAAVAALAIWEFRPTAKPKPSGPVTMTAAQIAAKYGPSVVRITGRVPYVVAHRVMWRNVVASGFVADKYGTIFTSAALQNPFWSKGKWVRGSYKETFPEYGISVLTVEFFGANGKYSKVPGYQFGCDPNYGTTLIYVDPAKVHLVPIPLGESDAVKGGEPVVALSRSAEYVDDTAGKVAKIWRTKSADTGKRVVWCLKISASSWSHGVHDQGPLPYFGGPLIDTTGHAIGAIGPEVFPANRAQQGVGCAIPIDNFTGDLAFYSKNLTEKRSSLRIWPSMDDPTPAISKALGLAAPRGILVETVDPGGAAARAGIRGGTRAVNYRYSLGVVQFLVGDLIVAVDGTPTPTWSRFVSVLNRHKPGDTVPVKFYRGRRLMTVNLTLDAPGWMPPKA